MNKQAFLLFVFSVLLLASACKEDEKTESNKPFIVLKGSTPLYWSQGVSPYIDPGAEAWDITAENDTVNISDRMIFSDNVNVDELGEYSAVYNVSDEAGNQADEKTRVVKIVITK